MTGEGQALGEVEFLVSGQYEFVLGEQGHTCTIRSAEPVSLAPTSWGRIKALYRDERPLEDPCTEAPFS